MVVLRLLLVPVAFIALGWWWEIGWPKLSGLTQRLVGVHIRSLRQTAARRMVLTIVREAMEVLPEVAGEDARPACNLLPEAAARWAENAINAVAGSAVAAGSILLILANFSSFRRNWENSSRLASGASKPDPRGVDPITSLIDSVVNAAHWVAQAWQRPWGVEAWPAVHVGLWLIVWSIGALTAIPLWRVFRHHLSSGRPPRQELRGASMRGDDLGFVILMVTAARCAREYVQRDSRKPLASYARISLRPAENVIRGAARGRYSGVGRRRERRDLKAHVDKVAGALRAIEYRQDIDRAQALRDMTTMLVTVADRYAHGRIALLLDEADLTADPVAENDALRLIVLGALAVGLSVGLPLLHVPAAEVPPMVAVVVGAAGMGVYRWQRPSSADVLSMVKSGGS